MHFLGPRIQSYGPNLQTGFRLNWDGFPCFSARIVCLLTTTLLFAVLTTPAVSIPVPEPKPNSQLALFSTSSMLPVPKGKPERVFSSDLFSSKDLKALEKAINYLERGLWTKARQSAKATSSQAVLSYVDWQAHQDGRSKAPFEALRLFLKKHPDWPRERKLIALAESRLPEAMPAREKLAWFEKYPPISGIGLIKMGEALLSVGKKQEGRNMIVDGWVNGDFSKQESKAIYRRHKKLLRQEDHIARLDRLLWDGKRWPAKRMYGLVPDDWKKLSDARIHLRIRAGNVDTLITRVPEHMKDDPGLVYERVRWRRKKRKLDSALELLLTTKNLKPLSRPEKWWVEKRILIRWAMEQGRMADAQQLTLNHGLTEGAQFAEAEFLAGWLALEFMSQPKQALRHFVKLDKAVSRPVSKARAAYWAARAARSLGDETALSIWAAAATNYPTTYYGQLAIQDFGKLTNVASPFTGPAGKANKANLDDLRMTTLLMLAVLNEHKKARYFADHLGLQYEDPVQLQHAAKLLRTVGQDNLALRLSKRAAWGHVHLADTAYPLAPLPAQSEGTTMPEHALILAVMRQESGFDDRARSHAGARGLMQLMPATAKLTARKIGIPYSKSRLSDPDYNAQLGAAHLAHLLNDFNGSYIMTLAAYNAGSSRVNRWTRQFGDPRDGHIDPVNWVERIPFTETRNYVQRIMENLQVYRHRLAHEDSTKSITLAISADLQRGSSGESTIAAIPRPNPCHEALAPGLSAGEIDGELEYESVPDACN